MSSRLVVLPFARPTSPRSTISLGNCLSPSPRSSMRSLEPRDHELLLKLQAIRAARPLTANLLAGMVDDIYADIMKKRAN